MSAELAELTKRVDALEKASLDSVFGLLAGKLSRTGGSMTGDLWWAGKGGLVYGAMYAGSAFTVTIADTDPHEVADATDDGWTGDGLNGVTFPTGGDEHYLAITKPGMYLVLWDLALSRSAGATAEAHAGVAIDGTPQYAQGESRRSLATPNDTGAMSALAVFDCPNGNEQISLWAQIDTSVDIDIQHGDLFILQVGGT